MGDQKQDGFLSRIFARRSSPSEATEGEEGARTNGAGEISWADNRERPVSGLVSKVLRSERSLIVTGYQDFLSALTIILDCVPDVAKRPEGSIIRMARRDTRLDDAQSQIIARIKVLAEAITTGTTLISADPKRAGQAEIRFHDKSRIHIRNFLAVLRSSVAFARIEWLRERDSEGDQRGRKSIGESLRRAEASSRRALHVPPGELQEELPPPDDESATPICDRIRRLLESPALQSIDEMRAHEMLEILNRHVQVLLHDFSGPECRQSAVDARPLQTKARGNASREIDDEPSQRQQARNARFEGVVGVMRWIVHENLHAFATQDARRSRPCHRKTFGGTGRVRPHDVALDRKDVSPHHKRSDVRPDRRSGHRTRKRPDLQGRSRRRRRVRLDPGHGHVRGREALAGSAARGGHVR